MAVTVVGRRRYAVEILKLCSIPKILFCIPFSTLKAARTIIFKASGSNIRFSNYDIFIKVCMLYEIIFIL